MTITSNTAFPFRLILLVVFFQGYLTAPDLRRWKSYNHRQIEPYACYDQMTKKEGICMFAWNCRRANGTHLTYCMDRFYFGSCCRLPPEYYIKEENSTTVDETSDLTTTVSTSSSARPITSGHTMSTSFSFSDIKTSTEASSYYSSTKLPYPTPSTFAPGLVTWRPLEEPHEVPGSVKRKPTTPMISSTADIFSIEYPMKTKTSTKQPFPSYPTIPSSKTKPTISHAVKVSKPSEEKVTKPTTQRPSVSLSVTTPQQVVRPRPIVKRPAVSSTSATTPQDVARPRPTVAQGAKVPKPSTSRPADIPESTIPHSDEISTTESTKETFKPDVPHVVEISKPSTSQPFEDVSEPNVMLSSKPYPVKLPGLPHETLASKTPVQHEIKTPEPTPDSSHKITYPPHVVEILRPGLFPSSVEIHESTISVETEKSTSTEHEVTGPFSETYPSSMKPSEDSSESQQLDEKETSSASEPDFFPTITTKVPVEESTPQTRTQQTTQRPEMEVTASKQAELSDIFQVTSFISKEGSPGDSSEETTVTSPTASDPEEFDATYLTSIQESDTSVIPLRETEDSGIHSTTHEIDSLNDTEILDVLPETTLDEIMESYEIDSQSSAEETQTEVWTSSALLQSTLTTFHSTKPDPEIQSRYPDTSEPVEEHSETNIESFTTTPFKCKSKTKHPAVESDFVTSENAGIQQISHIGGTAEEELTKQTSSSPESDTTHVTSATTTPGDLEFVSHETTQTPEKQEFVSHETTQTPEEKEFLSHEITQTPEKQEFVSHETTQTPEEKEFLSHEITQTPEKQEFVSHEITQTPEEKEFVSHEITQTPEEKEFVSHETTQTPEELESVSQVTTQEPEKLEFVSHITTQTPQKQESAFHVTPETSDELASDSHVSTQPPEELESISHVTTQTPEELELVSHVTTQTPEELELVSHVTTQEPEELESVSLATKQTSEVLGFISHVTTQAPERVEFVSHVTTQVPERVEFVSHITTQTAEKLDFDSHFTTQTTEKDDHSSLSADSTVVSLKETESGHAVSTDDAWDPDQSFSGATGPQETYQSSDLSLTEETQNYTALSWVSVTTGKQEDQTSSGMTTTLRSQQDTDSLETSESSEGEVSDDYGVTEIYITTQVTSQQSTKKEISLPTSTFETKLNIWTGNESQTSTYETISDFLNLTTNPEGEASATEKLPSPAAQQIHSLHVTHSELLDTKTKTDIEENVSDEQDVFSSTVLGDSNLTSEKYIHSSAEETEPNTESSTQSTTSYLSSVYGDHVTEASSAEILTTAGVIQDFGDDFTKDITSAGEYLNDITSSTSSDVFTDSSISEDFADHSSSKTETMQPSETIASEETERQTTLESIREQDSFTTYKEKTENLNFTNEYVTKLEMRETTFPDIITSQYTLANNESSNSDSLTTSSTENDSLDRVSQSSLSTSESQSVTERPTTYPSIADSQTVTERFTEYSNTISTHSTADFDETFSVDIDVVTDSTSFSETSRTVQTEHDIPQTDYLHAATTDITVKYVTSSLMVSDSDNLTDSITTTAEPLLKDVSTTDITLDSADAAANEIGTTSTSQKNTTYIVETNRPWEDIAAGVIEMIQGAESHPSSPKTTLPPVQSSTLSTTGIPVSEQPTTIDLSSSDYTQVCGRPLPGPVGRIVGGGPAHFGEWPWVVSLRQWKKNTFLHKCGAALVNEFWVITAAHCIEGVPLNDILLRLGEYDITHEDEPLPFVERRIQIVAAHPKFDKRTFEYDLALLRFYEPVTFQRNIIPICIPEGNNSYVGKHATVAGWGRLYEDGPLPNVIQEVTLPVITNDLCEEMYRKAGFVEEIPDIFICAGYGDGGKDSCEGDSGGPMVIQEDDGRWVLAGVISWGIGCALPNQPGVYTRITKFSKWINQIIVF